MLDVGERAPEFALPDERGETVRLSDLLNGGPVVLFFYPMDFSPACTAQACSMRDLRDELAEAGYRPVGISGQSQSSHARFDRRHELGYTLLADEGRKVARAYGALTFGVWPRRVTFVIGADGVVRDRVVADVRVGRHAEFVRRLAAGEASGS
ncbi:MAG: peroxiredoxin [Phycisphaerales bacterium JB040]